MTARSSRPAIALLLATAAAASLVAQAPAPVTPPPPTPRLAASVDLTGYWVSVVTTEWRYRMMPAAKGDYQGIPLTPAARKLADAWNAARDAAANEQCRGYGAPAIIHVPGRLHITWADDATLKLEADAGTQTRLFRFASSAVARPAVRERTWQGQSLAAWPTNRPTTGGGPPSTFSRGASLKVTTTGLRAGYLRNNGAPYSENATLTEYFDVVPGVGADQWLIVTTYVEDAVYLQQPLLRSVQFKKQADATGWDPTPCNGVRPQTPTPGSPGSR